MQTSQQDATEVIYALYDPREPDLPQYVGITVCPLELRLSIHKTAITGKRPPPASRWIAGLLTEGVEPLIKKLDDADYVNGRTERFWVNRCREINPNLINVMPGRINRVYRQKKVKVNTREEQQRHGKETLNNLYSLWVEDPSFALRRRIQRLEVKLGVEPRWGVPD